jgi:hypothetical protein
MSLVATAVRMLAVEAGQQAGEVLLGQVKPPTAPAAGLRHRLRNMREAEKLLDAERLSRAGAKLKAAHVTRKLPALLKPKPPWLQPLIDAATAFDTEINAKPPDPAKVAAAASTLITRGDQARVAVKTLKKEDVRQKVVDAVDTLYMAGTEMLAQVPPVPKGAVDPHVQTGPQAQQGPGHDRPDRPLDIGEEEDSSEAEGHRFRG